MKGSSIALAFAFTHSMGNTASRGAMALTTKTVFTNNTALTNTALTNTFLTNAALTNNARTYATKIAHPGRAQTVAGAVRASEELYRNIALTAKNIREGSYASSVEIEAYAKKNNVKVIVHSAEGEVDVFGTSDAATEKHVLLKHNHFYPATPNGEALSPNYSSTGDCFYTAVCDRDPTVIRSELADFITAHPYCLDVPLVALTERQLVGGNPGGKASAPVKPPGKAPEKPPEKAPEKPPGKAPEKPPGKAPEKPPGKAPEKPEKGPNPVVVEKDDARDAKAKLAAALKVNPHKPAGFREFSNNERKLPNIPHGSYYEAQLGEARGGDNAGKHRLILGVDNVGNIITIWQTNDHYTSFTQIRG